MRIVMNYGKKGLPIDIPEGIEVDVIRKKDMPVIGEPEEAVRSAIENPVGCDNLQEIIKDGTKICILVCDVTRPVPHGVILPVLILMWTMQRDFISGMSAGALKG